MRDHAESVLVQRAKICFRKSRFLAAIVVAGISLTAFLLLLRSLWSASSRVETIRPVKVVSLHGTIDNDNLHFMRIDEMEQNLCLSKDLSSTTFLNKIIPENVTTSFSFTVSKNSVKYFQLCFSKGTHQLEFDFLLLPERGDCDMLLSASQPYPSSTSWDWRSSDLGEDHLSIRSYAPEFHRSGRDSLFIAVSGRAETNECTLRARVRALTAQDLLRLLSPLLRGGQVMLPRDLIQLQSSSARIPKLAQRR
jgi:hypothetical protein